MTESFFPNCVVATGESKKLYFKKAIMGKRSVGNIIEFS